MSVKSFSNNYIDPNYVFDKQTMQLNNQLRKALNKGLDTQTIQELLDNGANPNFEYDNGGFLKVRLYTPLYIATSVGNLEAVKLLLANDADPNQLCRWVNGYGNGFRATVLNKAVEDDRYDIAQELLKNGANPNEYDSNPGAHWYPLHNAKDKKMKNLLKDHGATKKIDFYVINSPSALCCTIL